MTESERITQLTALAKQGDQSAFTSLYDTYASRIYYFCRSLLKSEQEAKKVTRDVFVFAWCNIETIPDGQTFYHWLCGNAFYLSKIALVSLRGSGIKVVEPENEPAEEPEEAPTAEPVIHRSDLTSATELLVNLPDSERICVLLTAYAGFSEAEAAGIVGCSERAARIHAQNGCSAICTQLEERNPALTPIRPLLARLLRTCGKKSALPPDITEGIRAELSKQASDVRRTPSEPEKEPKARPSLSDRQWLALCIAMGVLFVGALCYIIYWFASAPEPAPDSILPDPTSQVVSTVSEPESEPTVSEAVSASEESESAVSAPAESSASTGTETPLPYVTENLRLRSEPDTSKDNRITVIPCPAHIEILGTTKDANGDLWYRVSYTDEKGNRYEGYCYAEYVQTAE